MMTMDFTLGSIWGFIDAYTSYVYALVVVILAPIVAKIADRIINSLKKHIAKRTSTNLDDMLLESAKRPVTVGIFLVAAFMALKALPILYPFSAEVYTGFTAIFAFYAAYFLSRVAGAVIEWYSVDIASRTKTEIDDKFLPILKKVAYGIIFGIVILAMLGQLGIRIETLIATLGIGGLALALALQPTLANFFSGMQMVLDRPLRIGDYVKLDSGQEGTVTDIGWRSTRIRTPTNNILTIPNSRLADSAIMNYDSPTAEVGFSVTCGVAYDSDLDEVEKASLDAARDVMKRCSGVKDFEPVFRYTQFGPSSIDFKVIMRTKTLADSLVATHEFIKALKKRFDKEGIEIPFPQMDVHADKAPPLRASAARKGHRAKRKKT